MTSFNRSTYTQEQISAYFERIRLPRLQQKHSTSALNPHEKLRYLSLLQKLHMVHVPFENLSIHYSPTKTIDIDPAAVFEKMVVRGRGGYCMEQNLLFYGVLRTIGYDLYSVGARVFHPRSSSWGHMINIVAIDSTPYVVDVGYGGRPASIFPMPLQHDCPRPNIGGSSVRLMKKQIFESAIPASMSAIAPPLWLYEHRAAGSFTWVAQYYFTLQEFLSGDFAVMNYFTSTARESVFTFRILVTRMRLAGEKGGLFASGDCEADIDGVVTLQDRSLKMRIGEETETLRERLRSEDERVEALEKYFGLHLSEAEKRGILGTALHIDTWSNLE